ncbi:hypothetical protein [Streptacidiphilus anmyonensis]|uniref:hypothetical protein n=1 Tax=Streptacidiphilus anmyonensis TaxID=405782 RepID=UPI0013649311|nr:hypothetical protein [Streptacidiphilus anmyonensis]
MRLNIMTFPLRIMGVPEQMSWLFGVRRESGIGTVIVCGAAPLCMAAAKASNPGGRLRVSSDSHPSDLQIETAPPAP